MANTVFDTDFQPDDEVPLHDGPRFHWSGKAGDMTESDREGCDVATRFLLDKIEECRAPFAR